MTELLLERHYAAVLIYETSSSSPGYQPLFEEEIVLIKATSEESARESAVQHAKGQEVSYKNELSEAIHYSFKFLLDVRLMDEPLAQGSTLYTRHFRDYEAYSAFEPLLSDQSL